MAENPVKSPEGVFRLNQPFPPADSPVIVIEGDGFGRATRVYEKKSGVDLSGAITGATIDLDGKVWRLTLRVGRFESNVLGPLNKFVVGEGSGEIGESTQGQ